MGLLKEWWRWDTSKLVEKTRAIRTKGTNVIKKMHEKSSKRIIVDVNEKDQCSKYMFLA